MGGVGWGGWVGGGAFEAGFCFNTECLKDEGPLRQSSRELFTPLAFFVAIPLDRNLSLSELRLSVRGAQRYGSLPGIGPPKTHGWEDSDGRSRSSVRPDWRNVVPAWAAWEGAND